MGRGNEEIEKRKETRKGGRSEGKNEGINSLNADLNPICYLLVLLETHHILHVMRIRFKQKKEGK